MSTIVIGKETISFRVATMTKNINTKNSYQAVTRSKIQLYLYSILTQE